MDTIKRVQDLMQERDMNLCVLTKKCGISYSTIQSTARFPMLSRLETGMV